MTLMEQAQKNIVTKEVEEVAKYEQVSTDFVLKGISEGTIVIPKNIKRIQERRSKRTRNSREDNKKSNKRKQKRTRKRVETS